MTEQWKDRPDKLGWWWASLTDFSGKHSQLVVVQVLDFDGQREVYWSEEYIPVEEFTDYYPYSKWLFIPEPELPEMER